MLLNFFKPKRSGLAYLKALPHSNHVLDPRLWVNNSFFPRLGGLKKGEFFRFLAMVNNGIVTLYFGCPPGAEWDFISKIRGICPSIDLVWEKENPVEKLFPEGIPVFAGVMKAANRLAPFNYDNFLIEFPMVLEALGANRLSGVRGLLDVWFVPEDSDKWRHRIKAEAIKMLGFDMGRGGLVAALRLLGATPEALSAALTGKTAGTGLGVQQRPRLTPVDQERAWAYLERAKGFFFKVHLRFAVQTENPTVAAKVIEAAGGALRSLLWFNRLEWYRCGAKVVKAIKEGYVSLGEPWILMTAEELAQIIVLPGQENPRLWMCLERMFSKTAPPPPFMLGGSA